MPDKPLFDSKKPFIEPGLNKGDKPAFNPNKDFKPIAEKQYKTEGINIYDGVENSIGITNKQNTDDIISNIPDLSDGEKQTIKKLAEKGLDKEIISNSILTFQGKHPKQANENIFGGTANSKKHYYDENGVPQPLGMNERPPKQYDMASIWGNKEDANDDDKLTTLGKSIFNILPNAVENIADVIHLPYVLGQQLSSDVGRKEFLSGQSQLPERYKQEEDKIKEADWYNNIKAVADRYKMNTSTKSEESILKTENINKISDIAKLDNWNITADNMIGTIGSLAKSVGEFALGGEFTKALGAGTKSAAFAGSYMTQFGDVLDEAKRAGLSTEDAYKFSATISTPLALVDIGLGVEGKIFSNQLARDEKKTLIKNIAEGFIKDSDGKITKESLDKAFDVTLAANTSLAKNWLKETGKTTLEEAGQESLQKFIQNAGEQIHDKLSNSNDAKFGTDALDAKSFAEYLQEGIMGAIGGAGPSAVLNSQSKNIEKDKFQKNSIFEVVKKGEESVDILKNNLSEALKNGDLNQEQYDNAVIKVDSYNDYNRLINNKKLDFDDNQKREVFDKTFQKEDLERRIKSMGDISKLNPIDLAEYNGILKQSHDLQKDINDLIINSQIKKETTVAEKTVNDIAKKDQLPKETEVKGPKLTPQQQALIDKYKKAEDVRSFEDVPVEEWNDKKYNARNIFSKTVDYLENKPDKTVFGKLVENPFVYKNPNETYAIELPDGKKIRFSSSMTRNFEGGSGGFKGHFRQEHFSDIKKEDLQGQPMAMKVVTIPAVGEKTRGGKDVKEIKAIKIVRADNGKFIGWAKATNTGSTDVSEEQANLLEDEQMSDRNLPPTNQEVVNTPIKPISPVAKVSVKKEAQTKEDFVSDQLKQLLSDPDAQVYQDLIDNGTYERYFENQYDKIYGKTTATGSVGQEESATGNNQESVGNNTEENKGTEVTLKKQRAKPSRIKDKSRRDALKIEVFNAYDKAAQYFIGGGKLNSNSFRGLYQNSKEIEQGLPLEELKGRSNYVSPEVKTTIDDIANSLWESNKEISDDTGVWRNAVEEVLNTEPASIIQMAENLIERNKQKEERTPIEQEIIDITKDAESTGDLDAFTVAQENLEVLNDEELNNLSNEDNWEEDNDIIRNEGLGDQFQKISSVYGNVNKVLDAIKKALPKIKVKYDENLIAAGKLSADGKTITINPLYAGIDTPIHEAGHVIIDAMGYNDVTIQKAIKQLEKSKLWKETKKRYPELSQEMLGKEVLSEAIGREGAGIFEKESNITKFQKLLDKIFQWFKDKLGLERNEAKKLAKQILRGEFSDLNGTNTGVEQFQKEPSLADDLREINAYLKQELSKEEREQAEDIKANILDVISESLEIENINKIIESEDLNVLDINELILAYNTANDLGEYDTKLTDKLKLKIASYFNKKGKEVLRKNEDFLSSEKRLIDLKQKIKEVDSKLKLTDVKEEKKLLEKEKKKIENQIKGHNSDLSWLDVRTKVLSHMTENFPELQQLSGLFDQAYFDKITESDNLKSKLKKKALAVIKEQNKKLGLGERFLGFFSSNNAKYFEYLDDKGQLRENTSGLTEAQKELLKFMKELLENRNTQLNDDNSIQNDILKIDKGFQETFKTESLMSALSNYFGGSELGDLEVKYKDKYGNKISTDYLDAQKSILNQYKGKFIFKGIDLTFNPIALGKLLNIAYQAKKKSGRPAFGFDYKGRLTNKFDKPRNKDLGYSKDFYKAAQIFIDDYTHTKHMSKFVPIVNSLDYLYSKGYGDELQKPNAKEWLKEWSQTQIYQTDKVTDPIWDASWKFLRNLTSQLVMGFALKASGINLALGIYNTWWKENSMVILKGNKRLFGKDGLNKYSIDLLNKYKVVNIDRASNPNVTAGSLFQQLAFGAQKFSEWLIQGSSFLGRLSEEEFNSFEYNKEGELVLKSDAKKGLEEKFNKYKNEVSDVQGKYSEKDRRNFARGEFWKSVQQFKTWIPDWYRMRFGAEYIDMYGETKRGSARGYIDFSGNKNDKTGWDRYIGKALEELQGDISKEGFIKGVWNNKQAMTNLKGALTVASLLVYVYGGDDDEDKRKKSSILSQALGNVLFIFDPDQAKYTLQNPVAGLGTLAKFIDVFKDMLHADYDKFKKDVKKVIPYNKFTTIPKQAKELVGKEIVK